jgi:hypothetical protein
MELRSTHPRALENIADTMDIVNVAATQEAEVEAGVDNFPGRTLASDVINWADLDSVKAIWLSSGCGMAPTPQ